LRQPFEGELRAIPQAAVFAHDVVLLRLIYDDGLWGPYLVEDGIEEFEARLVA